MAKIHEDDIEMRKVTDKIHKDWQELYAAVSDEEKAQLTSLKSKYAELMETDPQKALDLLVEYEQFFRANTH